MGLTVVGDSRPITGYKLGIVMSPVPDSNVERSQVPKVPLENLKAQTLETKQILVPTDEAMCRRDSRRSTQSMEMHEDFRRRLMVAGAWALLLLLAIFAINPAGAAWPGFPIVVSLVLALIFLLYQAILLSPWKRKFSPRHLEVLASSWIWLLSFMLSMFSSPGRRDVLAGEDAWRMREDPGNSTAVLWILCVLFAAAMSIDLPFRQFGVLGQVIALQHLLISALLPTNSCSDAPPSFGGVFLGLPPWLVPSLQLHGCALGMSMVRLWQDQDLQVRKAVKEYLEGKEVPVILSSGMDGSAVKTRIEMITDFLDGEIDFLHELLGKVQHLATSKRAHVDWMRSVDFLLDLLTSSADVLKQTQIYTDEGEERDLQDQLSEWIGAGSRQPTLTTSPMVSVNESAAAGLQIPGQMPSTGFEDSQRGSFQSQPAQPGDTSQFSGLQQAASAQESALVTVDPSMDPWNKDLHVRSALGVGDWNFDALNAAAQHQSVLKLVGMEILNDRPMLPKEHLPAFLETLESRYDTSNPYHSNVHAADMTNAVYFMFESCGLQERVHISETSVTCMYLAALGHDVGHPGYNNNFLINFRHDYAITYSDRSVLENFHAAELIRLLSGQVKGVNFLGGLPEQQQKQERFWMTSLILNTDMSKLMQDLSALRMKISSGTFAMEDVADQQLVMGWLFRSADIGHSAKPWSIHEAWSMRVVQEFHAQGDREIQLGLPVSPLCDRTDFRLGKSQAGFLQFVCLPTFLEIKNLEELLCEDENEPTIHKMKSQGSGIGTNTSSMLSPPMGKSRTERPSQLSGGHGRRRSIAQLAHSKSRLEMLPSPQATFRAPSTPAPGSPNVPAPNPQTPESTPRQPSSARRRPSQPPMGDPKVAPEPSEKRRASLGSSTSGKGSRNPKATKGSTSSSLGSKPTTRVIKARVYLQCKENMETWQRLAAEEERNASEPRPSKGSAYPAPASSSSNEGES